jgi:hypothetical protein
LKKLNLPLFASSILLMAACASAPPKEPPKNVPAPQNVTLEELNTAIEGGVKIQNEKGEEMICRREAKTGSRLARETICMTQAEWVHVSEESQRATKKTMRLGKIPHGT